MKIEELLKKFVQQIIFEAKDEEILGEPDMSKEDEREDGEEKEEQSVAAAVPGVTTPLGTDATYPRKKKKKSRK